MTSNELRISYWSSDVCSSDLLALAASSLRRGVGCSRLPSRPRLLSRGLTTSYPARSRGRECGSRKARLRACSAERPRGGGGGGPVSRTRCSGTLSVETSHEHRRTDERRVGKGRVSTRRDGRT